MLSSVRRGLGPLLAASHLKPWSPAVTCVATLQPWSPAVTCVALRHQGILPPLETKQLNSNMQLRLIQAAGDQPRPVVLLFSWMLAKQKHLDKYSNMYHSQGMDVLTLQMQPSQVLVPQQAQATVDQLLTFLQDPRLAHRPLMVHGFSVGGYMYGELLVKLEQNQDQYKEIRNRLVGQVFDSPVDFEGVASGFASVLVENRLARRAIEKSLEFYLAALKNVVTRHYLAASAAFHNNELRLPSLMLYSRSDPIGVDTKIEQVMKKWKTAQIPVFARCWESSPHVSHFHRHPDEYVETILRFLDTVGLTRPKSLKAHASKHVNQVSSEIHRAL